MTKRARFEGGKERLRQKMEEFPVAKVVGQSVGIMVSAMDRMPCDSEPIARAVHKGTSRAAVKLIKGKTRKVMERDIPEELEFSENPHRRPFLDIIKDGLHDFKIEHPEIPITWERNDDYTSVEKFLKIMQSPLGAERVAFCRERLHDLPNIELNENMSITEVVTTIIQEGSYKDAKLIIGKIFPDSLVQKLEEIEGSFEDMYGDVSKKDDLFYTELGRTIEEESKESQSPSLSKALTLCLEYTDGDLGLAMNHLGKGMKILTRFRREDSFWVRDNILDEYSDFVPYHELPDDESIVEKQETGVAHKVLRYLGRTEHSQSALDPEELLYEEERFLYDFSVHNQVGKPYHLAHMVSLLRDFSPEMITLMVGVEYSQHGPEQGMNKLLADLRTISELYDIKDFVESYQEEE